MFPNNPNKTDIYIVDNTSYRWDGRGFYEINNYIQDRPLIAFKKDLDNYVPKPLTKNITSDFSDIIYRKDAVYINNYIQLKQTAFIYDVKQLIIRNSFGDIKAEAKIVYNDGYAYIYSELLSKTSNWEFFTIEYDLIENTQTYVPDLKGRIGKNYMQDEILLNGTHSETNAKIFECVYLQLGGTKRQALRSDILISSSIDQDKTDELAVKYKFNILGKPYGNGSYEEEVSSCPDILSIASHYDNTYDIHNITNSSSIFLNNTIAVSAGTNQDGTGTWTSYGNGVEFFESYTISEIDSRYPESNFRHSQLWYTIDSTHKTLKTTANMNVGLYYTVGETLIWKKPDTSEINVIIISIDSINKTITFDTDFGEVLIGNPIEIYRMITVGKSIQYWPAQSPTCSIIAAKFALIQDLTDANWQIVREAARMTATNSTMEIIDGKKIYTTHWDNKRGFGIIDITKAVEYINDNYINNQEYKDSAVPILPTYNPFLSIDDIDNNNPITKKQLLSILQNYQLIQ